MKKLIHLLLASLLLAGLLLATTAATAAAPYANNRAPLREKPFVKLRWAPSAPKGGSATSCSVRPTG